LISQTTSNFLNVGADIIDQVAATALTDKNVSSSLVSLDITTDLDRGAIFRFRDTDNRPLAAVKVALVLTNSLGKLIANQTEIPQFTNYPPILDFLLSGPLSGTLEDNIAKDTNYKDVIKANKETKSSDFAQSCDNLQATLRNIYGLNRYDESLAMALILYSTQAYFSNDNLSTSQCFKNPAFANVQDLKKMGLDFKKPVP
jgi:hypothetical protein